MLSTHLTMPGFARHCCWPPVVQQSINISCRWTHSSKPAAVSLLLWAHAVTRQTDRHHTIMLTLLCILYRQCQKVTISSAPSLRVYNNPFVSTVLYPIWKPSHCQYHGEFYTRLIKSCIKLPELFKTCWLISAWHVHIIISPLQWTTLAKIPEVKYPFPSITNTADKNSQMFILHYSEEFLIFKHSDATVNTWT